MNMIYRCSYCGNRVNAKTMTVTRTTEGTRKSVSWHGHPPICHHGLPYTMASMPETEANKLDQTPEGRQALRRKVS